MSDTRFVIFTASHDEVIVTTPEHEAEVMKTLFGKGSGRALENEDMDAEAVKPGEITFSRRESSDSEVLVMSKFMVE